jgi:hypothetical protein
MGSCVYKKHAEQHHMASDAASLGIVDLNSGLGPQLILFDIIEIDIMGGGMDDAEDEERICDLSVEPLRFIERKPSDLWSDVSEESAAHGEEDQGAVHAETEPGTS